CCVRNAPPTILRNHHPSKREYIRSRDGISNVACPFYRYRRFYRRLYRLLSDLLPPVPALLASCFLPTNDKVVAHNFRLLRSLSLAPATARNYPSILRQKNRFSCEAHLYRAYRPFAIAPSYRQSL